MSVELRPHLVHRKEDSVNSREEARVHVDPRFFDMGVLMAAMVDAREHAVGSPAFAANAVQKAVLRLSDLVRDTINDFL